MQPRLVIFDCDGVLVDSEMVSNRVLADNLARYGLTLSLADCMARFVGGTMANVMTQARGLGALLPDDWIDEIYAETYARLRQGVPLVSGVRELLTELDNAALPCCVASNGSEDKMRITLGQHGLWHRFQGRVFSAHTLGMSKPDPDLFLAASLHFGVPPTDCVVIEDSVSGATAAARAGMRCLGFAPHNNGSNLRALGADVFDDMAEVAGMLGL